ncbi:MAG TPA: hypothetical protein VFY61_17935 [Pyrinomonadaceae bacterium]|nr:hypothetical protein [Pyrinomonadaceae bacterium]
MNRPFSSLLALCATLLLCFQPALGQQTSTEKDAKAAALRAKAYDLLTTLADQLGTLQSAENRARIGSNIAGSIWTHDEKRARALFKLVEDDIKFGLQVDKKAPHSKHTFQVFYKLRENTAERMAKHDPELALAFVRDTASFVNEHARQPNDEISEAIARQEQALELRLAKQISAANPEVSIKFARQSLAHGFSRDLLTVLGRASKDKAQARELYKEIVSKLRDANFENWETLEFVHTLVQSYTPPAADEATFRELIQFLNNKAVAIGCTKQTGEHYDDVASVCQRLGVLFPIIERFYPGEARVLARWNSRRHDYIHEGAGYMELQETAENGTVEEVLSLTSRYPNLEANIRLRAMSMAESAGDMEQAEKIARNYMGDPDNRRMMEERITFYQKLSTHAEEQWAQSVKNVEKMPLEMQINILTNLAHVMAPRARKTSLKGLAYVSSLIDELPPGREQTVRLIEMAAVYCLADSDRGFAIVEGLMPKLNELIAASVRLDSYDTRYLRDGEWNMTAEGPVGNILTVLANNAGPFAWYDFDRAVALTAQFERSEIRMMAQLKLAQGILAGGPKRIPNPNMMVIQR